MRHLVIMLLMIIITSACSITPGDAARRAGHYLQAADLYEAGAEQGDPIAARKLAHLYNYKPGLPENHEKALFWYKKAIQLGDIQSYWFVGTIYRHGKGNVSKNCLLAEEYFLKGAEKGHRCAIYDLAEMYSERLTIISNDIEGLKWLNIVTNFVTNSPKYIVECQYIMKDSKKVREKLESRMTADQREKARELADDWIQRWKAK